MDRDVSEEPTDEIVFAEEDGVGSAATTPAKRPWKLIIVDDEEEVHDVTRLALNGFTFAERPLDFLSAYSGEEAKSLLAEHPDGAVVLLDVVMETDHAGLDVANISICARSSRTRRSVLSCVPDSRVRPRSARSSRITILTTTRRRPSSRRKSSTR